MRKKRNDKKYTTKQIMQAFKGASTLKEASENLSNITGHTQVSVERMRQLRESEKIVLQKKRWL